MSSVELFYVIFHTISDLIGMLLNFTLLYLVIYKTPRHFEVYAILIGNAAITDFLACLASTLIQQRLIPLGTSAIYISRGPCRLIGGGFCYLTYALMLSCYTHSLYCLLFSFYFRYCALKRNQPSSRKLKLIIALISIPSLVQIGLLSRANQPVERLTPILERELPQYSVIGETISGHESVFEWKLLTVILHMTVPVTPIYVGILVLRMRIISILNECDMSEYTKKIHSQLLRAITYQAILPALFFLGVLSYLAGQLGLCHHPLLENFTFFCFGILPILSPVMSLHFITPYKRHLFSLLGARSQVKKLSITTTETVTKTTSVASIVPVVS